MDIKRSAKISVSQQRTILEFLSAHPELTCGNFTSLFTYKQAQVLWHQLTDVLNAIPGAHKTWVQWRKIWQDKRNKTRLKKAKINNHRRGTGGGEVTTEVLTPVEEDVLCLIAPTHIEGHSGVKESTTEFDHVMLLNSFCIKDDVEIIFDKCLTPPVTSVDTSAVFNKHVVVPASTSVASSAKEIPPTLLATQKIEDQGTPLKTPAGLERPPDSFLENCPYLEEDESGIRLKDNHKKYIAILLIINCAIGELN
ncbi:hypothetical protein RN001_005849 [Aquatica leii]|uniref:Regulatory protein zeste n=1 Tax=Aquatica leii TaxID=1421715 RepID=A0AAN7Q8D2_9COLE|nr:hypothetical protein RN001_005849 [Aquatica leii]